MAARLGPIGAACMGVVNRTRRVGRSACDAAPGAGNGNVPVEPFFAASRRSAGGGTTGPRCLLCHAGRRHPWSHPGGGLGPRRGGCQHDAGSMHAPGGQVTSSTGRQQSGPGPVEPPSPEDFDRPASGRQRACRQGLKPRRRWPSPRSASRSARRGRLATSVAGRRATLAAGVRGCNRSGGFAVPQGAGHPDRRRRLPPGLWFCPREAGPSGARLRGGRCRR